MTEFASVLLEEKEEAVVIASSLSAQKELPTEEAEDESEEERSAYRPQGQCQEDKRENRQIAVEPSPFRALTSFEQLQRPLRSSSLYSIESLGPLHSSFRGAKQVIRFTGGDSRGGESGQSYIPAPLLQSRTSASEGVTLEGTPLHYQQHSQIRYPPYHFRKLPKAYRSPVQRAYINAGTPLSRERHFSAQPVTTSYSIRGLEATPSTTSLSSLDTTPFASPTFSEVTTNEEMPSDYSSLIADRYKNALQLDSMSAHIPSPSRSQFPGSVTHILPSDNVSANTPMFPTVSLEDYRKLLAQQKSTIRVVSQQKHPTSSSINRISQRSRANSESTHAQYRPGNFSWYETPKSQDKPLPRPSEHYSRPSASVSESSGAANRPERDAPLQKRAAICIEASETEGIETPKSGWDDDEEEATKRSNGIIRWNSLKFKSSKRKEPPKYPTSSTTTYCSYSDPLISTSSSRNVTRTQSQAGQAIYIPPKEEAISTTSSRLFNAHSRQGSSQSTLQALPAARKPSSQLTPAQMMLSPRPNNSRPVLVRSEASHKDTIDGLKRSNTATYKSQSSPLTSRRLSGGVPVVTKRVPLSDEYFRTMGWTKSARLSKGRLHKGASDATNTLGQSTPHRITLDADPSKTPKKAPLDCPLLDILKKPEDLLASQGDCLESNIGLASPIQLVEKSLPRAPSMVTGQIDALIGDLRESSQTTSSRPHKERQAQDRHTPTSLSTAATSPKTIGTDQSHEARTPLDPPTPSSTRCSPLSSFFEGYGDQSMPTADREQWQEDARVGKSTFGGIDMPDDMTEFPLWQDEKVNTESIADDQSSISSIANRYPSAQRTRSPYEGLFDAYVNSNVSLAASRQSIRPEIGISRHPLSRAHSSGEAGASIEKSIEASPVEKMIFEAKSPSLHIASQGLNITIEDETSSLKVSVMYRAALTEPGGKNDMNFCGAIALSEDDLKRICESWLSLKHRAQSIISTSSSEDANDEEQEVVSSPGDEYEEERLAMEERQEALRREVSTAMKELRNRSLNRINVTQSVKAAPPPSSSASSTGTTHIKPLLLGLSLSGKATRSAEDLFRKTSIRDNQSQGRLQRRPHSNTVASNKGVSVIYRSANQSIGHVALAL